jgi:O-Antigen ligase
MPRARVRARLTDVDRWGIVFCVLVLGVWTVSVVAGFTVGMGLFAASCFLGSVAGIRWPVVGLYSIAILCVIDTPMRSCLAGAPLFRDNSMNYVLLLYSFLYYPHILERRDPHTWILLALVMLIATELLMSPGIERGILHFLNATAPFGLLVVVSRGMRDERVWYWVALLSGLTAGIGGAIYYVQKSGLPYIDRNGLAYFPLAGMFAICIGFRYATQYRFGTIVLGLLAALCGCWVFLTTSRGGTLIGLFATVCLLVNIRGLGNRLFLVLISCVIAMGVLTQFSDIQDKSLGRIEKLFDSERSLASRTSGRSELMRAAWNMFLENPFGVGTGAFSNEYAEITQNVGDYSFGIGKMASSHSAWMKTLAENGFPGFILLFCYVYSFAYVGWKKRRLGLAWIGILPSAAFSVAYLTSEFQSKGLWFLAAGVTMLLHQASVSTQFIQKKDRTA